VFVWMTWRRRATAPEGVDATLPSTRTPRVRRPHDDLELSRPSRLRAQ
jgi:hypothetical protein